MIEAIATIVPRNPVTQLRLALSADEPFVRHLFKTARAGDFAGCGLPPAALDGLLDQQYRAQAAGYAAQFPDAAALIVLHRAEPVGRLIVLAGAQRWRLVDIVLLPAARGRGVGTDLIEAIARAAIAASARELALSVLSGNTAARRLYARLGFAETGGDVHVTMVKPLLA